MSGPSDLPDPQFNAFRKDLADIRLAGRVIASHYAAPVRRVAAHSTALVEAPDEAGGKVRQLERGETFSLLDDTLGWAWGYADKDGRVGYVQSAALSA